MGDEALHQRIAEKAYELYHKRGESHGQDLDDWLEAERLVLSEIGSQAHSEKYLNLNLCRGRSLYVG